MKATTAKKITDKKNVIRRNEVKLQQIKIHKKHVKLEIKTIKRMIKESIDMGYYVTSFNFDLSKETVEYFRKRGFKVYEGMHQRICWGDGE